VRIAAFDTDGLSQPSGRSAAQERRDEIDVLCGRAPDMAEGFEKIQSLIREMRVSVKNVSANARRERRAGLSERPFLLLFLS
jgi:hypothetical protein